MTYDDFVKSRREMTNREFGRLVKDSMWEDEPEQTFLVYADSFYISALGDGRYDLLIGNEETITSDTTSLSDLEKQLFDYAQSECYPEWQQRDTGLKADDASSPNP
ncbi:MULTISPECIES: hypothetical protein [Acetobacter]|uniref:Uncharacterized protein n=3 Tax=Acetobacter TaxID=434 RepID=A0A401WXM4_ACEPA|nr:MULTISPECIES: hypothetical protein [Acetobacter]QHM90302.1 hypothetical protein FCN51_01540 [Acetobacter pasteurianus]GBR54217.1 hypothetical protein AA11825_2621 [Acetobacter pomorum DSM 11825]GCD54107.1 hypothetical protein NBRC3188_2804 [Acetobacter pasteurianus NBRC 3188]GCD60003.1 hypothetical protein NBRC3277_2578 [Acetobacter pasteurianus NBRC 3277]GCD63755.1 hypothetical protein NBRC3278_2848 [Acetobacter pasteurianus NBRC 3278]